MDTPAWEGPRVTPIPRTLDGIEFQRGKEDRGWSGNVCGSAQEHRDRVRHSTYPIDVVILSIHDGAIRTLVGRRSVHVPAEDMHMLARSARLASIPEQVLARPITMPAYVDQVPAPPVHVLAKCPWGRSRTFRTYSEHGCFPAQYGWVLVRVIWVSTHVTRLFAQLVRTRTEVVCGSERPK